MAEQNELISIDEQIKKLQEKKKSLQEKQEREIGKYLLKSWGVYTLSTKKIFELIDSKKGKNNIENINTTKL